MLDRQVVQEFLESQMEDIGLTVPADIDQAAFVEVFCQYTEDDYYEWLKDNFKSFFDEVDWEWVREKVRSVGNQETT
ncbi:MAG: hypothetical protein O2783_00065 [Chloroflexi bacterium]|nr:hypothetical protein [Chloroflexota bacterium]